MKDLAIGVFDSGIGGLTAVKAISAVVPNENIIYFGDTLRMPYGNKSKESILHYAQQNVRFLESMGVKIIVAACGTVSSYIKKISSHIPIFEVITPACKAALRVTRNSKIGVIGTKAAIDSNSYAECISIVREETKCWQMACPLLASLIESGNIKYENNDLRNLLNLYISPLIENDIDTLILGCTHYPLVGSVIKRMFGSKINLINPSEELAEVIKLYLKDNNLNRESKKGSIQKFYVSGDVRKFLLNARRFLGRDINLKSIDIESY